MNLTHLKTCKNLEENIVFKFYIDHSEHSLQSAARKDTRTNYLDLVHCPYSYLAKKIELILHLVTLPFRNQGGGVN